MLKNTVTLVLISSTILFSTTYFVSNSGSDTNPGSESAPFKTIQKAVNSADTGDIIYVLPGTYQSATIQNRNFNGDQRMQILAYSTRPILTDGNFTISGSSYITLKGFEFYNSEIRIYSDSKEIIIEDNICHHARFLISIRNSNRNIIRNNVCYGSDLGAANGEGEVGIQIYDSHYNLVEYNKCYNMFLDYEQGDGIGVFWNSSYNIIRYNILHDNPDDNLDGWYSGPNNIIEHNVFYHAGYNQYGNTNAGNGKGMKTNYDSKNWVVRFNVSYNNKFEGFSDEDSGGDNIFYNNTAYNNGRSNFDNFINNNYIFKNNISCGNNLLSFLFNISNGNLHESDPSKYDSWFKDSRNSDFNLIEGSGLIDNGVHLTRTLSSGNGMLIPVENARYFTDGYGLIPGDKIIVGDIGNKAEITDIDYNSNIITIDRDLSWLENDFVSYIYSGGAPDQGSFEFIEDNPVMITAPQKLFIQP